MPIGVFGLGQIIGTTLRQLSGPAEMVDFVAFFTGGRLLLDQPSRLYDPTAWVTLQTALHDSGPMALLPFWNPPHTALLLAPLAVLPFGAAYLTMLLLNLACLAGACWLLAPRGAHAWYRLGWAVVLPLFLPVQLGLIMGQLSFALLLGFAVFVRLACREKPLASATALLAWSTKPQLLPVLLLSLVCMRRWRTLVLVCAVPVVLSVPVVLRGGWPMVTDYLQLAVSAGSGVLTGEGVHLDSGSSVLGLAQWLFGPGWLSNGVTLLGTFAVYGLVASVWRGGLHTDARRHVQLALLPLAAVLGSPHVMGYEAVTWLASAWLLLSLANDVPLVRPSVFAVLLVGWWGGNLAALPQITGSAPWGAFSAILGLAGTVRLYRLAARRRQLPSGRLLDSERIESEQARGVGTQQLLFERAPQAQVQDGLDRRLDPIRDIRKVAAEQHAVLELQHALDRRRAAQELVEHHGRIQKHALVHAAQVEERVELVGAGVGDDDLAGAESGASAARTARAPVCSFGSGRRPGVDQQQRAVLDRALVERVQPRVVEAESTYLRVQLGAAQARAGRTLRRRAPAPARHRRDGTWRSRWRGRKRGLHVGHPVVQRAAHIRAVGVGHEHEAPHAAGQQRCDQLVDGAS